MYVVMRAAGGASRCVGPAGWRRPWHVKSTVAGWRRQRRQRRCGDNAHVRWRRIRTVRTWNNDVYFLHGRVLGVRERRARSDGRQRRESVRRATASARRAARWSAADLSGATMRHAQDLLRQGRAPPASSLAGQGVMAAEKQAKMRQAVERRRRVGGGATRARSACSGAS